MRVDPGDGDDSVTIGGGEGNDTITYDLSTGGDKASINGGRGTDDLTINAGLQNFTVFDWLGRIIYKQGEGGTRITLISMEHGTILDPDGKPIFEW